MNVGVRRRLDRLGERHRALAWVLRVFDHYVGMNGRAAANSITLDGFLALFALSVLGSAILGFVSAGNHDIARRIIEGLGLRGQAATLITDAVNSARATAAASRRSPGCSASSSSARASRWRWRTRTTARGACAGAACSTA